MALTPLQVSNVCDPNRGNWGANYDPKKTCRFLSTAHVGSSYVCLCTKLAPSEYKKLEDERARQKKSYSGTLMGKDMGNNCKGYLYLKHKKQGYDVP